jgi:hypothetical protein
MAINPKINESRSVIENSREHLDSLRHAVADLGVCIDKSLKLVGTPVRPPPRDPGIWSKWAEETRVLAEMVKNPSVKSLLHEVAEIQDRMAKAQAPG